MNLTVIENKPKYQHTISESETTFIGSVDGKDFYYRFNGIHHNIDIRYSDEMSDYSTWTLDAISSAYVKDYTHYSTVIPKWVYDKVVKIVLRKNLKGIK